MSSSDGFCSTLSFAPGELGQIYTGPTGPASRDPTQVGSATPTNVTPLPTPTHLPSPIKATHVPVRSGTPSAPAAQAPPASPARSNSACSQSSQQQANVVNNPTPTLGSVPLVTATHSAQPLPLTTPPQTPMPTATPSGTATSSTSSVLGKRETRTASESEKDESKGTESEASSQQPKKRRIAPTLISAGTDPASTSKDSN